MKYCIGTRGSKLAVAQAEYVKGRLSAAYPEHEFVCKIIKTKGDLVQDRPLDRIGGTGVFVREIEEQLLSGAIHMGVHSMKDMPAVLPDRLVLARCWSREDPRDALILREKETLESLPEGAVVGTGSIRRKQQLLKLRPDLRIVDIRGNVDTRLRKMEELRLDGLVLASAGLRRLGMEERITAYLEPDEIIPAPAQGILAIEVREDQTLLLTMLDALGDEAAQRAAEVERGFLRLTGADCHKPVGALYTENMDGTHRIRCMFGDERGERTAYADVTGRDACRLAEKAMREIRRQTAGKVCLVGGGPGDPGLITAKGLEAVRRAGCIIYDRLIAPQLLKEAREDCELIYAGKAGGAHVMEQDQINRLLAEKAYEHDLVVRLKGGDVYVFGRGGEEGMYLRENGIPFEVIPGVSSCIAGPAYAGIPVTHRGVASGFHVATAHSRENRLSDIDFQALAKGKDTCVFLMGLSMLPEIAEKLMEAGMSGDTAAAVISGAASNSQKTVVSNLRDIAAEVGKAGLATPALIVVGGVVKLREQLNFFENRPLFGKRYLTPVIGSGRSRLAEGLEREGAVVTRIKVGEIAPLPGSFTGRDLREADWLIFTSQNGVEAFFSELFGSESDIRAMGGVKVAAVGERTEQSLWRYGIKADLVPEDYMSDALARELGNLLKPADKVRHVRAAAGEELREALLGRCDFAEWKVYENRPVSVRMPGREELELYDGVLFTCASSAERLLDALDGRIPDSWREGDRIFSIGRKTSGSLRKRGIDRIIEAPRADCGALIEAVKRSGVRDGR